MAAAATRFSKSEGWHVRGADMMISEDEDHAKMHLIAAGEAEVEVRYS